MTRAAKFGILIFPDAEELDFVGPWEMLTMWSRYAGGPEQCLLIAQTSAPVVCAKGMSVNPHVSIDQCPPLDWLLVPGGSGTRREVDNSKLIDFIKTQSRHAKAMLSVCSGAFMLQRAGLLVNKAATTHWGSLSRLREFQDVTVREQRYVHDGNIWTSAGVSAGIDMMLAFIADAAGEDTAGKVQFAAEYYPDPVTYGAYRADPKAPSYIKTYARS